MEKLKLKQIIEKHKMWLADGDTGERANLAGANLTGADLTRADLTRANLTGANLTGVNLTWTNLTGANLAGANLTGVNLTRANLTRANLTGADLTGVNLTRADLTDANLTRANLIVLNLPFYTAYVQKENTRIGCKYYKNYMWRDFTDKQISEMDDDALDFWTKYKGLIFAAMDSME